MGLIDAFSSEDRLELTVSQLITILERKANAVEDFNTAMAMCANNIPSDLIIKVFSTKNKEIAKYEGVKNGDDV